MINNPSNKNPLHTGLLLRQTKNYRWVTRKFIISSTEFYWIGKKKKKEHISISMIEKINFQFDSDRFDVILVDGDVLFLRAETHKEARKWCKIINTVVREYRDEELRMRFISMRLRKMSGEVHEAQVSRKRVKTESINSANVVYHFDLHLGTSRKRKRAVAKMAEEEKQSISMRDFRKKSVIGEGGYSKVYLVEKIDTKKHYAMKVMSKNFLRHAQKIPHVLTELNVLTTIDFPFLVKAHFAFQSEKNLYLVMDFINGGELLFHLGMGKFTEHMSRFYLSEIVLAIEHLHSNDLVYRDLKPENILIGRDGHVVLVDFGLSKFLEDGSTQSCCGTIHYMDPEIINGDEYSFEVDWWAVGILLFELMAGYLPFYIDGMTTDDIRREILHFEIIFPDGNWFSEEAKDLIRQLTEKNILDRLVLPSKIKAHPFFQGIQWDDVLLKEVRPPFVPQVESSFDLEFIDSEFLDISTEIDFTESIYNDADSFIAFNFGDKS